MILCYDDYEEKHKKHWHGCHNIILNVKYAMQDK